MLNLETIDNILNEYIEQIVPNMWRLRYHLKLVKGGPDYPHLSEQSHFAHIINGAFGLIKFVQFLVWEGIHIPGHNETAVRKALALYTLHDLHKSKDYEKFDKSEFAIPLARLRQEYEALGLTNFAKLDNHLLRYANVHSHSPRHGDAILSNDPDANFLWLLVRIADTFASVDNPQEAASSLKNYLEKLGLVFALGKYQLYYHEIKDIRGVLTNTIHNIVAGELADKYNFYDLLFFATGTLYIGPRLESVDRESLISEVVDGVLTSLTRSGDRTDAIKDGIRGQKFDFEQYVYTFASAERLLDSVHQDTLQAKPNAKKALSEIDGLIEKDTSKKLPSDWRETVEARFQITLADPKTDQTLNDHWSLVYRYLLFVDALLRDLNPTEDRLTWFLKTFNIPSQVGDNLKAEQGIWGRGGIAKYVLIIAYHFLQGSDFAQRPADTLPSAEVLNLLHARVSAAVQQIDTHAGREKAVAGLGFRRELTAYLAESLNLSFVPATNLTDDVFAGYTSIKRKGHNQKVCSLCNRQSEYGQELRTGILDDFGRVFSNRVLPAPEAPGQNRSWCPVCHLEFIFRKLTGMGLPSGAHYKNSRRIYLYVLPTFSFTSEHVRLFKKLLNPFQKVTNIPVRDYGKDWSIPHYWLEARTFDPDWLEKLSAVLERTANKIAEWGGRGFVGERVTMGDLIGQPHYYLISWEKVARETEADDARLATRTEAWAKALFAATLISGLTSCKVYVTERPYLPVIDPSDLKPTITLDSPPPAIRGLLGRSNDIVSLYGRERTGQASGLETTLDLSAALWMVTTNLKPGKDKDIAGRLERLNIDPLAGAFFYKEYGRENEGQSPPPPLTIACDLLLTYYGGDLMDLVEKIAQTSLEIALPLRPSGKSRRGKAHRYELIFREGISAMRKAQQLIPEMRQAALSGQAPSPQAIAELKRLAAGTLLKGLERRQGTKRGEIRVRLWGETLSKKVGEFMDILVDDLYRGRAGASFARLIRLENSLADGIYYYTDCNLSQLWDEYRASYQSREDDNQNQENEDTEE